MVFCTDHFVQYQVFFEVHQLQMEVHNASFTTMLHLSYRCMRSTCYHSQLPLWRHSHQPSRLHRLPLQCLAKFINDFQSWGGYPNFLCFSQRFSDQIFILHVISLIQSQLIQFFSFRANSEIYLLNVALHRGFQVQIHRVQIDHRVHDIFRQQVS